MSTSAISCGPRAPITPGAGPYASGDSLRLRTALNTLSAISSGLRSSVRMYTSAARRRDIDWGPERMQEQKDFMDSSRRAADAVSYTHLRAHETKANIVCRLLLEKKKKKKKKNKKKKKYNKYKNNKKIKNKKH